MIKNDKINYVFFKLANKIILFYLIELYYFIK